MSIGVRDDADGSSVEISRHALTECAEEASSRQDDSARAAQTKSL
jgi:hypothetical protein